MAIRTRSRHTLRGANQDLVTAAASRYGVPADIVLSVAQNESGFRRTAVSSAGAVGIMQLIRRRPRGSASTPATLRRT